MVFAQEIHIAAGFDNWLENAIAALAIVALLIHVAKLLMPKPAMEKQLEMLQDALLARLAQMDQDMIKRMVDLRAHIDLEVFRIHERVDSHGRELFHLKGRVDGWREHMR